ncbi:MAG: hypothetical protein ISQ08_13125 [Planctomycetes bacterium]|nr:hypothetical protein [Planctomycetota bacterium]
MNHSLAATAARLSLVLASTASLGLAQLPQSDAPPQSPVGLLKSPGMPRIYWGQTTRFTSAWNPAAGVAFDGSLSFGDDGEEDGFALDLNVAELTLQGAIAPDWWGNFALETNSEEVELTESALFYMGLAERTSLRAGKFFIDFGKQMQVHVHDLMTPQRPAVLREYLGTEVPGTGFQLDHWSPIGDETAFRFSLGLFGEMEQHGHGFLFGDDGHGHGGEGGDEVEVHLENRRALQDLIVTARATAMTDAGDNGVLQVGASYRSMPDFGFEAKGRTDAGAAYDFDADGLDSSVLGLDLTYGWNSLDGTRGWTTGAEFLRAEGALAAELDDPNSPTALQVFDGSVQGWFAYADHAWNQQNSVGVMVSAFEHLEDERPEDTELTLYWTHFPTEFARIRFAAVHMDREEGEDAQALMIQLTGYIGAHGHPYNW